MATVLINIKELPTQLVRDEARLREAIARGARAGAERGRTYMSKRTPIDLGQLRAGWKVKGGSPAPEQGGATLATLDNDAPHVGIVELGARPHTMSPAGWAAIYEWVRRHPELYTHAGSKKNPAMSGPNQPKMRRTPKALGPIRPYHGPDPEISAITNAIVQKIRKVGQKPTYFIRKNLDALARLAVQEVAKSIAVEADAARRGT
jgi:hypothetical protein